VTYDESERTERNFHGITFLANATENRRVAAAVVASQEWREWAWRDDLIKSRGAGEWQAGEMRTSDPRMPSSYYPKAGLHWICKEAAEWFQKLVALTLREVEAMEADR
jgi:hypothetical protein